MSCTLHPNHIDTGRSGCHTVTLTPAPAENHAHGGEENDVRFVSAGQRIHNELTYRGVDFLLNSAIGVGVTYATARTQAGQKYFGRPVTEFFKTILSPILTTPKSLEEGARWGSMFTSIIVGGTMIIPPMTMLEKKENKKKIVRKLDEKIYGKDKVESDPRFTACYDAIDGEPKKNFTTGMAARILVLVPMIGVTLIPPANERMVKYLYNPIGKGSKWLCKKLKIEPQYLLKRGRVEVVDGGVKEAPRFLSDMDFIHRTVGFDLGLTFIYSFAHEAAYKALAAAGFKQTEEEAAAPTPRVDGASVHPHATPLLQEVRA